MASWDKMTKYTHKSSDEFDSYEEALTGVLRLHKDKLDPFLKGTDMNTLTKRPDWKPATIASSAPMANPSTPKHR